MSLTSRSLLPRTFFFFNDTATTEIYTLSLHDALPISGEIGELVDREDAAVRPGQESEVRSEEHTSELQSRSDLVCRLLLEKKKAALSPQRRPPKRRSVIETLQNRWR